MKVPTAQTYAGYKAFLTANMYLKYFSEYFVNCCIGIKTVDTEPELKDRERHQLRRAEYPGDASVQAVEIKENQRVMT